MIKSDPAKSLRDHGRRREADRRGSSSKSAEIPALAGQGREPEVLRRRASSRSARKPPTCCSRSASSRQRPTCRSSSTPASSSKPSTSRWRPLAARAGDCTARMTPLRPLDPCARRACSASPSSCCSSRSGRARRFGGFVSKTFLADPLTMVQRRLDAARRARLRARHRHDGLARASAASCWRRIVAVPLGIAMGAYKPIEAFFEPFVSFARYLPASAFIPLLILWAGIGETAEAARDLHRLGLPDRADGRGHRRQHAARPGRGGLHAGRQRPRHRPPRAAARPPRRRSPRRCGSCSAGPGPT